MGPAEPAAKRAVPPLAARSDGAAAVISFVAGRGVRKSRSVPLYAMLIPSKSAWRWKAPRPSDTPSPLGRPVTGKIGELVASNLKRGSQGIEPASAAG